MMKFDTEADLLRMIRLAPQHLRSDDASFIRHVYREGLGREPEYDPAGPAAPSLEGDGYLGRSRFICSVATSVEGLQRGHEATLDALAAMLGHGPGRAVLVAALRDAYPTPDRLMAGIGVLAARIERNSRGQDLILAMCLA